MLALCAILLLAALVGAVPAVSEDPIVSLIKEVIYEADQYIEENHLDILPMPDIGKYFWEPLHLRNGRLSNFSSLQLVGTPTVKETDNPDGSTLYTLMLPLGLDKVAIDYDYSMVLLYVRRREGVVTISTTFDSAKVEVEILISKDKCNATLNNVVVEDLGEFTISIVPDDIPEVTIISQAILNLVTPNLLPFTNIALNDIISSNLFQKIFSQEVCENIPL